MRQHVCRQFLVSSLFPSAQYHSGGANSSIVKAVEAELVHATCLDSMPHATNAYQNCPWPRGSSMQYLKDVLVQGPQTAVQELCLQELAVEGVAGLLLGTSSLKLQLNLANSKHDAS